MIRVVLFHVAIFAVPFIAFVFYAAVTRRTLRPRALFDAAPLFWLAVAGAAMTVAAFLIIAALTGGEAGSTYRPAKLIDGVVVPGQIVPPGGE